MQRYYVHHNNQQLGPWSLEEIHRKLDSSHLNWTDYLYDESKKDWVLMMQFESLARFFNSAPAANAGPMMTLTETSEPPVVPFPKKGKLQSESSSPEALSPKEGEWFVLKGENKYGPFPFLDMVKMLQEKKLFEFDYVWNLKMDGWKRVADVPEFQPKQIRDLKNSGKPVGDVFFRRRHARVDYGASILIHNKKEVWKGQSLEVSPGGAGVVLDSDQILVGEQLFLHFKAGDGVPPFNATCEIVSKHPHGKSQTRYGVKFVQISQSVQRAIKKLSEKAA